MDIHALVPLERRIVIRTPENLELAYSIAGAGTRSAAYFIDVLIISLAASLLQNVIAVIVLSFPKAAYAWGTAITGLLLFALFNLYFIIFEWLTAGQTPGKRAVAIRVIRSGGYSLRLIDVALRNLLRAIDFLPVCYGVGLTSLLVTRNSQRLGDLVAGTFVVHQQRMRTEDILPEIPASTTELTSVEVNAVPRDVIDTCVDFFRAIPDLAPRYRQEFAGDLIELIERTGRFAPKPSQSAEAFLAAVIRQSEQTPIPT